MAPARRGRPALRAVARRRELRHGADRGVRVRHPGRGLATSPATATWSAHGMDGLLVPRRRRRSSSARRCATWRSIPSAAQRMAARRARARRALRLAAAWPPRSPRSTSEAVALPRPRRGRRARRRASGSRPPSRGRARRPSRLPSLEPKEPPRQRAAAAARLARRGGRRRRAPRPASASPRSRSTGSGIESIGRALLAATPVWVLVGFALMCASMLVRAEAWHAILRAALPGIARAPPRHRPRNDDRRADVGHAAGAARRALARADRGAPARPDARPLPGRARHARLPDAAQHPRARACSAR